MITYTAKNHLGFEVRLTSRRDDMRHMVSIRHRSGDWTHKLSAGKSQTRILGATRRAHPDAIELRVTVATAEHITSVVNVGGRYPHLPTCSCGYRFWGYVAPHAARDRADAHVQANSPKGR